MITDWTIRAACLCLVATMAGCTPSQQPNPTASTQPAPLESAAVPNSPARGSSAAVDDREKLQRLTAEAEALIAAGRTVKLAILVEQLKIPRCRLELPATATASGTLPLSDLYDRMRRSTVVVGTVYKCDRCSRWHVAPASGFMISPSGVCVTNYHVVNDKARETIVVMTADGRVVPARSVLAANEAADVALLQLDGEDFDSAPLAPAAPVGTSVRVLSHPDGRFYTLTEGIISRYFVSPGRDQSTTMMAITADYAKGSSGGPVFNDQGAVVGLVASTSSIYYEERDGKHDNLQMVVRQCVPAANVLELIER